MTLKIIDLTPLKVPELVPSSLGDTVILDRNEFEYLLKCERYVAEWGIHVQTCPKCGELYPKGCICICGQTDKTT